MAGLFYMRQPHGSRSSPPTPSQPAQALLCVPPHHTFRFQETPTPRHLKQADYVQGADGDARAETESSLSSSQSNRI